LKCRSRTPESTGGINKKLVIVAMASWKISTRLGKTHVSKM
jgi:hypothetical protein